MQPIRFTIFGQTASKSNRRRLVKIGGEARLIKSPEAVAYARDARRQIPPACRVRLQGPVCVTLHMFYASERPDMDEQLLLDTLQDHFAITKLADGRMRRDLVQAGVYQNDRQVRERHTFHHIDKRNPRVEIEVRSIAPTADLFATEPVEPALPF